MEQARYERRTLQDLQARRALQDQPKRAPLRVPVMVLVTAAGMAGLLVWQLLGL